eukprot:m.181175 g.181175  ORF g.181175 m.181175 type:complete len:173 (+) comp14959_c0_seq7:542-1060(+)
MATLTRGALMKLLSWRISSASSKRSRRSCRPKVSRGHTECTWSSTHLCLILGSEQKMIEEYEREIQALDEESRAQIESEEFAQTDGVVCPVCTKNWLLQRFNAIFCVCGFRFENRYGGVSLHTLKMCLESAAERHSSECPTVPQFGIESEPATNIQRLILRCADCDSFEIVI